MEAAKAKKIAGIILAAGGSKRMGQPKLLLEWHGAPLIHWVARTALAAGCSPLIVVTGANADAVTHSLAGLPVVLTHNPSWEQGQSTSVRTGVNALPPEIDAAIIFLADQPQIPASVVQELMRNFREDDPPTPILITTYSGQRGNPVLFDRALFQPLAMLEGDAGARSIFTQYPVHLIPFDDPDLLLDVDSPKDYQRLMKKPPPIFPSEKSA